MELERTRCEDSTRAIAVARRRECQGNEKFLDESRQMTHDERLRKATANRVSDEKVVFAGCPRPARCPPPPPPPPRGRPSTLSVSHAPVSLGSPQGLQAAMAPSASASASRWPWPWTFFLFPAPPQGLQAAMETRRQTVEETGREGRELLASNRAALRALMQEWAEHGQELTKVGGHPHPIPTPPRACTPSPTWTG